MEPIYTRLLVPRFGSFDTCDTCRRTALALDFTLQISVAGGILAIFGRIKAVDPIAGTQAAQIVANRMQQAETPIEDTINQSSMMTLPLGVILSELPSVIEAIGQLAAIPKLPANQNVNFAVIPASPPNGAEANALAAGNAPN